MLGYSAQTKAAAKGGPPGFGGWWAVQGRVEIPELFCAEESVWDRGTVCKPLQKKSCGFEEHILSFCLFVWK